MRREMFDPLSTYPRAEFKSENLELTGALNAITGIRKIHQALIAS